MTTPVQKDIQTPSKDKLSDTKENQYKEDQN